MIECRQYFIGEPHSTITYTVAIIVRARVGQNQVTARLCFIHCRLLSITFHSVIIKYVAYLLCICHSPLFCELCPFSASQPNTMNAQAIASSHNLNTEDNQISRQICILACRINQYDRWTWGAGELAARLLDRLENVIYVVHVHTCLLCRYKSIIRIW